jgi:PBSX family phage terminase large subunit
MAATQTLPTINSTALNFYFETAKHLGVAPDALQNFQRGAYVAQPKQLEFHAACRLCDLPNGPTQIGFGGARGPGKSHALFAQIALDDCGRFAGLKVLYLRKVAKNAREQFEDLRRSVLRFVKHDFKRQEGIVHFSNGSRIIIGHFKNESDIDSYLGLEYDIICIEEATTLTESKFKTLRDSNRTSKEEFRPRIYCSTNPGGVGHGWFKKRFIQPAREGSENDTRFIFATVDDNAFIDADYTKKLEENSGWKLRAYRYGDWDIAAGQFFSNWNYNAIVKTIPSPKPYQQVWCALDYGFTHPTVCYLFAAYDGKIQVVDEFRARKQLPAQNAREIKEMLLRHKIQTWQLKAFVAGRDVFDQKGDEQGKTIAQQYQENGIKLTTANVDRINGAGELLKRLGDPLREKNPIQPTIEISTRCVNLINLIPNLQHDPHRPEDVLKVNADDEGENGDDEYDALRYGILVYNASRNDSYSTGVPYPKNS